MADLGDKLRQAGVPVTEQRRRDNARRGGASGNVFPPGYPQYFTEDGHTRVELVAEEAQRIAEQLVADGLTRRQLRVFYDHAMRQLQRLQYGNEFGEVHPQVVRLKAAAADRAARRTNNIPPSFKEFIDRNIDKVMDKESFIRGFMPHFEAVVAYSARARE